MAVVDIGEIDSLGLIVKSKTGVHFANQVGGYGCFGRSIEGVYVPIPSGQLKRQLQTLSGIFRGQWKCLSEETAGDIDNLLVGIGLVWMKVDRALATESFEAWIHVELDIRKCSWVEDAPNWQSGVLTWQNSD